MALSHNVPAHTPGVDEQEDFKKDPLARASSSPRAGGGGGCWWCHKKKPGWPGVAVFKIPPQVPLASRRGLVGGSSDRRDSPVFSDGRPGARSRRDTKRSDWHQRVQPGRVLRHGLRSPTSFFWMQVDSFGLEPKIPVTKYLTAVRPTQSWSSMLDTARFDAYYQLHLETQGESHGASAYVCRL